MMKKDEMIDGILNRMIEIYIKGKDKGEAKLIKILKDCDSRKRAEILYLVTLVMVNDTVYSENESRFSVLFSMFDSDDEVARETLQHVKNNKGGPIH